MELSCPDAGCQASAPEVSIFRLLDLRDEYHPLPLAPPKYQLFDYGSSSRTHFLCWTSAPCMIHLQSPPFQRLLALNLASIAMI